MRPQFHLANMFNIGTPEKQITAARKEVYARDAIYVPHGRAARMEASIVLYILIPRGLICSSPDLNDTCSLPAIASIRTLFYRPALESLQAIIKQQQQ